MYVCFFYFIYYFSIRVRWAQQWESYPSATPDRFRCEFATIVCLLVFMTFCCRRGALFHKNVLLCVFFPSHIFFLYFIFGENISRRGLGEKMRVFFYLLQTFGLRKVPTLIYDELFLTHSYKNKNGSILI